MDWMVQINIIPENCRGCRGCETACAWWDKPPFNPRRAGERIWNLERMFNCREGLDKKDDYPPERLMQEPIKNGSSQGESLNREKYNALLMEYYGLRGWDLETGIPTSQTRSRLGLSR